MRRHAASSSTAQRLASQRSVIICIKFGYIPEPMHVSNIRPTISMQVAEPMGVIAGIIPTTNPTSTAIFKSLIALKTRNSIVIAPHPRAPKSTGAAARAVYEGALAAGAPEDIVQWIEKPEMAVTMALMKHPGVALILATGGPGMVKSAMSSAHPAIGVGAGIQARIQAFVLPKFTN